MKHVTMITKQTPAKAENLLAKRYWLGNVGEGIGVVADAVDVIWTILGK